MINQIAGLALAVGVVAALVRAPSHEARVAPGVKRRALSRGQTVHNNIAPVRFARSASLWRAGELAACAVQARWSDRPVSANFAAVMCMDGPMTLTRVAYRPLETTAKAGFARKVVKIQHGAAPVVRLVASATIKPKRALYGALALPVAA